MYQVTVAGPVNHVANPFTGTTSCPAGFTPSAYGRTWATRTGLFNFTLVEHYICLAPDSVAGGGWDFTGAFQDNGNGGAFVANTYAGSAGADCPAGTGTPRIHGWGFVAGLGSLSNHRFCSTGTRTPGRMTIGGVFQRAACGASVPNALTGATTCPEGFSEVPIASVHGNVGSNVCAATQFVCKPRF